MAYTIHIDESKCNGCTICTRVCPTGTLKVDKASNKAYNTGEECDNLWGCLYACRARALSIVEVK